ncbi:MAG: hypothetical protein JF609_05520 [Verrucomicrobia bacterium]|nr:hypothetical protein [Verrucomicrobiota bacterium]
MKHINVRQPLVFPTVSSRSSRGDLRLLALMWLVVVVGFLMSAIGVRAQTPILRFSFEDGGLTTTTNTQGGFVLTNFNAAGTAADLHGPPGSGISGQLDNNRSLLQTNASYVASGGVNGPGAWAANSPTLAAIPNGTITTFTATEWFKSSILPPASSLLGRLFVLGAGNPADVNAANTIGMKWQNPNQWYVSIANGNPTAQANFSSNLPTNTWLFMGIVYDGTNVMIYQGTDTASARLISTTFAPGLTTSLGGSASLYIGNRNGRQRAYVGWIDEFRFYTNASSASAVEAIREQSAGGGPVAINYYPDGLMLQQATNKFVFNAVSPNGVWGPSANITNIQMTLNGVDVSSQLVLATNGTAGTSTNVTASYLGLPANQVNSVVMTLLDANGKTGTSSVTFDTYNPTNFIVEAEEFDFNSGQYIDNADYTSTNGDANSYYQLDSVAGVDTAKITVAGGVNATDYRFGATDNTKTQTPASTDLLRQRFLNLAINDPNVVDHVIWNYSSSDWQNYTRTYPTGNYNIYGRLSTASSGTLTVSRVTSGQGTGTQTTTNIGTMTVTGISAVNYSWVPLKNALGNLAVVNIGGLNTLRVTSGGGAQANFYMLVPANTNLPGITGIYPNKLLQPTNKLSFTTSSTITTINTNSITVSLNGTNVTSSLVFAGCPSTWTVSYPGLLPNTSYTAAINVTDANGGTSTSSFKFDTWNPAFQVEAEDFDFSSGQYIDNPAPTTGAAGNSYYGRVGTMLVDESINGGTPFAAGSSPNNYRPSDPIATTPITDTPRQQFVDANASDYNVGFLGVYFWQNYTRTWPAGTYNVYVRAASGAGTPTIEHLGLDQITGGWGTSAQFIKHIGGFTVPTTGGYSAYLYVPLIDQFGNYANVTTGGTNTYRVTIGKSLGVNYPGDTANGGVNMNFYMLVAARTDLARIDGVSPNNLSPLLATNTLAFVASSPNGVLTTNVQVVLNGVNISSNLVFTGSSSSWNVSYPGLLPGMTYTAVITVKDNNNQIVTTTVSFGTSFNSSDFTWEAEDFDFDPNQSPASNGSGLRYIDNPAPTSSGATNSYFGQLGDSSGSGVDYSSVFSLTHPGTYIYRQFDYVSTEVTSDQPRQKFMDAQQLNADPTIADYDVNFWATNGWINYTRTFPAGNFYLYARLSAASAFNLQCAVVTDGWGTASQTAQYLGSFRGTNTSFANWQYVPLVNTNTGLPVVLSLGGTNTLKMTGDYKENANFFELVSVPQIVNLSASLSGTNIVLSFPSQSGSTYTVTYKNNLTDASWTPLGTPITGDGTTKSVNDSLTGGKRFYRLMIQ